MNAAKILFGAAAVLTAGTLVAQTVVLDKVSDWEPRKDLSAADGVLSVKSERSGKILSSQMFKIDPAKTYVLSFETKADGLKDASKKSTVYAGFFVYDKDGKEIVAQNVLIQPDSFTEVAADAKKGSRFILVKDLSKLGKFRSCCLVGDAKEDLSDLPNRNLLADTVKSVAKDGEFWKIEFSGPLKKTVKAGTKVRIHRYAGLMYVAGNANIGTEWVKRAGTAKGTAEAGTFPNTKFVPCATQFKIIILTNYNNNAAENQFRNVTLTIK